MDVDLEKLVASRSEKDISPQEFDAIYPLIRDYVNVLRSCQSREQLPETASSLRHLEKVYRILRKAARKQAAEIFVQKNAPRETAAFLHRLEKLSEEGVTQREERDILDIKADLYDLLLNANNHVRDESQIADMVVDEGVCMYMFKDFEKYKEVYKHEKVTTHQIAFCLNHKILEVS